MLIKNLKEDFDPSELNDSVALKTYWGSTGASTSSYRTHKLVQINSNRIEFKASLQEKAGSLSFFIIGALVVFAPIYGFIFHIYGLISNTSQVFSMMGLGLIFMSVGAYLFYIAIKPIVFDKNDGYFWKGRVEPKNVLIKDSIVDDWIALDKIHALQLINRYVRGSTDADGHRSSSYYGYELNLVLDDGKRLNVLSHGNRYCIIEDTKVLSKFLQKPIWNTTNTVMEWDTI
ncbi:MAG: hypothetical protein DRG30_04125 [Epsilonproteobacteria bacterium]|nr:MAG: hypothetical protein DRG30_04125 [Campylobacterota bacterium]